MRCKGIITVVLFALLILSLKGYGQEADSVMSFNTKVLEDAPFGSHNLTILFNPLYSQPYPQNPNFGFAVGASYRYKEKFIVNADFMQAWGRQVGDRQDEPSNPFLRADFDPKRGGGQGGWPVGGSKPYREISIGGVYLLKKNVIIKDIIIKENIDDSFTYKHTIPQQRLSWYGPRLGVSYMRTFIHGVEKYWYYDTLPGEGVKEGLYFYGTMMQVPMISIGFAKGSFFHTVYEVNDFGQHHWSGAINLYGDILFSPRITLTDINLLDENQNYNVVNFSELMGNYPVGFRLGASRTQLTTFGFNYGMELGVKPGKGYWLDNSFMMLKAWFNLSATVPRTKYTD